MERAALCDAKETSSSGYLQTRRAVCAICAPPLVPVISVLTYKKVSDEHPSWVSREDTYVSVCFCKGYYLDAATQVSAPFVQLLLLREAFLIRRVSFHGAETVQCLDSRFHGWAVRCSPSPVRAQALSWTDFSSQLLAPVLQPEALMFTQRKSRATAQPPQLQSMFQAQHHRCGLNQVSFCLSQEHWKRMKIDLLRSFLKSCLYYKLLGLSARKIPLIIVYTLAHTEGFGISSLWEMLNLPNNHPNGL